MASEARMSGPTTDVTTGGHKVAKCFLSGQDFGTMEKNYVCRDALSRQSTECSEVQEVSHTQSQLQQPRVKLNGSTVETPSHHDLHRELLNYVCRDALSRQSTECSEVQEVSHTQSQLQKPRVKLNGSTVETSSHLDLHRELLEQRRLEQQREQELALQPPLELEQHREQELALQPPLELEQQREQELALQPPLELEQQREEELALQPPLELEQQREQELALQPPLELEQQREQELALQPPLELEQHREEELALQPPLELETELRKRQQILLEYEQEEIRRREEQERGVPEFVRVKDNLRRTQMSGQ
ncbi:unnamed protein product [Coregonus sp. 'balchen']|nr:unnamed protein product [Coregonus sp. 'balchen']